MYKLWILVISLAAILNGAWGQSTPARVPQPIVSSTLNGEVVLACDANEQPLTNCIFDGPGADFTILVSPTFQEGKELLAGYFYKGNGLQRGECGIRIRNVKESDNGRWNCKLITSEGKLRNGVIDLEILKKPDPPGFSQDFGSVSDGSTKEVVCYSFNGQPQPSFKWFIGEKPIEGSALSPVQNDTIQGRPRTFQRLVNYKFTWENDRKQLRCLTVHDSLTKDDRNEVSQTIVVTYSPRADDARVNVKAPEIGSPKVLAFNVSANPVPNVVWYIGKTTVQAGFASPDQRYEAKPLVQVGGSSANLYLAELVIKKVQETDLDTVYKLRAQNQLGAADFEIRLSNDPDVSDGLGAGGIVGLVLGIPVLIILIVLIVVYARAKGMLCFKGDDGTSSEKERMGGDGDSNKGGVEENKPTISARLSAFYENLMSKKKDKTAPMDEEAPKEKEKELGTTDEKKPDDIVYAELDLARGGTEGSAQPKVVVRGTDEKTEYAEIVGVVPPGQGGEEEKKKTPVGSNNPSPKK